MARKPVVVVPTFEITSDLSGTELTDDTVTNVKFTLKVDETPVRWGHLDLSVDERETLIAILAPYFKAAQDLGSTNYGEGKVTVAQNGGKPEEVKAMRDWAMATHKAAGPAGYIHKGKVLGAPAERGRLSGEWKAAYADAHSTSDQVASDEGHASEAAIESAIATGEAIKAEGTESATAVKFAPAKPAGKGR